MTNKFTELPKRVKVPPKTVAKDSGNKTREGDNFRFIHQASITGKSDATTGVLGTTPETGATTNPSKAINLRGVRILSEAINSLKRSRAPLLKSAAETANKPINVIKAGLPKPANAF